MRRTVAKGNRQHIGHMKPVASVAVLVADPEFKSHHPDASVVDDRHIDFGDGRPVRVYAPDNADVNPEP